MAQDSKYFDQRWRIFRLYVLERDNFTCRRCGITDEFAVLHVHHLLYVLDGDIWEVEHQELITLCRECHFEIHGNQDPTFNGETGVMYWRDQLAEDFVKAFTE